MIATIQPGETATNKNPGGGGYGDPFDRPIEKVTWDVKNRLVSIEGAREDYGVVIVDADTLEVDQAATTKLRGNRPIQQVSKNYIAPATQRDIKPVVESTADLVPTTIASVDIESRIPRDNTPIQPLIGADVGRIRIVDFNDPELTTRKNKKGMKIRYF